MAEVSSKVRRASRLLSDAMRMLKRRKILAMDPMAAWEALGLSGPIGRVEFQLAVEHNFRIHPELSPGTRAKELFLYLRLLHVTTPENFDETVLGLCERDRVSINHHMRRRRGRNGAEKPTSSAIGDGE